MAFQDPFQLMKKRSMTALLISIFFSSVFFSFPSASYAYDILDPDSNITIKWDLLLSSAATSQLRISIFNFQQYRHIDEPGWKLNWIWQGEEVIWDMRGAEAIEQGNCSRFQTSGTLPHCCEKQPVIVDRLPGTPYNQQSKNCCRGGVLSTITQDPTKYVATFEMSVGGGGNASYTGFVMPINISLGIPGYSCGEPFIVRPTKFSNSGGRHKTQALQTWDVRCVYSQMQASERPRCCVSLSAFYNNTIVDCPRCSCGCRGSSNQNCVKRGEEPSFLQLKQKPDEDPPPPVVVCSRHMCPIRVHWHIKQSYREYWRVKITVNNLNVIGNYSQWTLVVLHPNLKSMTQIFSFNHKSLNEHGYMNDTAMFWGISHYNDLLLQAGKAGNVQTEMLLHKDEGMFTFSEGWGFPRRIMFNGEDCVMPAPDDYPSLPSSLSSSIRSPFVITILLSFFHLFFMS